MLIHAFKRIAPIEIEFAGRKVKFPLNEHGHAVADIDHQPLINRLLGIPTDYRPYELTPAQLERQRAEIEQSTSTAVTKAEEEAAALALERSKKPIDEEEDTESSPYILTDEDSNTTIDLRQLDLTALRVFAKSNDIPFHPNHKEEKLREIIVAQLNNVGGGEGEGSGTEGAGGQG